MRGNRISLKGEAREVALGDRLLDELVTIIRTGQGVTSETVERVITMLRAETTERPADVLSLNILSNRGRSIRPKTLNQKRYVDSIDKHTITSASARPAPARPTWPMAKAVQALQAKNVNPDHPDPARGRGGGAARLPARHAEREDRPLPAPAVRRAARHDRPGDDPEAARRRDHRGRAAGVHAGPGAAVTTPGADARRASGRWASLQVGDLVIGSNGHPDAGAGRLPAGPTPGLPGIDPGRRIHPRLWRAPVDRGDPGGRGTTRTRTWVITSEHGRAATARLRPPFRDSDGGPGQQVEGDVPIDPYAMGLLLGDGCLTTSTTPAFATKDPEPAEALGVGPERPRHRTHPQVDRRGDTAAPKRRARRTAHRQPGHRHPARARPGGNPVVDASSFPSAIWPTRHPPGWRFCRDCWIPRGVPVAVR